MTLLEKICKELGVEVGEEWIGNDGVKYMIDSKRIVEWYEPAETNNTDYDGWVVSENYKYKDILTGKLKPIWRPTYEETYFTPSIGHHREPRLYNQYVNTSDEVDRWYLENNMVFKTKEEAIKATKKMLNTLKAVE